MKPENVAHRPALHERIDQVSKTTLAVAGVFFAVGMVIDNIQLQALGIHDVSVVQARFVLVGVAFAVYLLLPAALIAGTILAFRWTKRAVRARVPSKRWWGITVRTAAPVLAAVGMFLTLWFLVLPSPFVYFIERVKWSGSSSVLASRFWSYYFNGEFIVGAALLYIPTAFIASTDTLDRAFRSSRAKRLNIASIMVGIFSSVMPYVENAYPNLARSVGGGRPLLAQIDLAGGGSVRPSRYQGIPRVPRLTPVTKPTSPPDPESRAWEPLEDPLHRYTIFPIRDVEQPTSQPSAETVLLWHESGDFLYVSRIAGWNEGTIVHGIPKSRVDAVRYRQGILHFKNGQLEHASVNVDLGEVDEVLVQLLFDLRDVTNAAATTRPLTPKLEESLKRLNDEIERRRRQD